MYSLDGMKTSAKASTEDMNKVEITIMDKLQKIKLEGIENIFKSRYWFLKQAWSIVFN